MSDQSQWIMFERILPSEICSVDVMGRIDEPSVWPQEWDIVAQACAKRRQQFAAGRHCLRHAIRKLGAPDSVILKGARGEPLLASGLVGSITHCDGYCAAAAACSSVAAALGIDAELNAGLQPGVLDFIAIDSEREQLRRLAGTGNWDRVLFSAKESVYKAWVPLAGSTLGFKDVSIELDTDAETFEVEFVLKSGSPQFPLPAPFRGRFLLSDSFIITAAICLRANYH
jgi:4'-phosphopantetheinyl transferase EntD